MVSWGLGLFNLLAGSLTIHQYHAAYNSRAQNSELNEYRIKSRYEEYTGEYKDAKDYVYHSARRATPRQDQKVPVFLSKFEVCLALVFAQLEFIADHLKDAACFSWEPNLKSDSHSTKYVSLRISSISEIHVIVPETLHLHCQSEESPQGWKVYRFDRKITQRANAELITYMSQVTNGSGHQQIF